jgi:hypothetical protein
MKISNPSATKKYRRNIVIALIAGFLASCAPEKNPTETSKPDIQPDKSNSTTSPEVTAKSLPEDNPEPQPPQPTEEASSPKEETAPASALIPGVSAVRQFSNANSDAERIALLKEVAKSENGDLTNVVRTALSGSFSPEVAIEAIRSATTIKKIPEIVETMGTAVENKTSSEVAAAAIDIAAESRQTIGDATMLDILRKGLGSEFPEVRQKAVSEIAGVRPKYSIGYILPHLDDPDPTVQKATVDAIENLFGRTFESGAEADQWWGDNALHYDEKINLVTPLNED